MDPRRGGEPAVLRAGRRGGRQFFDTANVYSAGSSEEITGRALADFARREEIVLATKVHGRMRPDEEVSLLERPYTPRAVAGF